MIQTSTALVKIAVSAMAAIPANYIELGLPDKGVTPEMEASIDAVLERKGGKEAINQFFMPLILKYGENGEALSSYIKDNDVVKMMLASKDSTDVGGAYACYSNCYSNCYTACVACHGARGWR